MERAEEWAQEKGCESVYVRSNAVRERAHRFYERIGYTNVKTSLTFRKALE
jgi:GNAT superfamily N-acetyltransferase